MVSFLFMPNESLSINIQSETLNITSEILDRYNVPGPRYTSYPTAPEWHDSFGPADYYRALERSNESRPPRPIAAGSGSHASASGLMLVA